eukprot:11785989-Alexandrium_andersonii.AAC.1
MSGLLLLLLFAQCLVGSVEPQLLRSGGVMVDLAPPTRAIADCHQGVGKRAATRRAHRAPGLRARTRSNQGFA